LTVVLPEVGHSHQFFQNVLKKDTLTHPSPVTDKVRTSNGQTTSANDAEDMVNAETAAISFNDRFI
jgi:hypothetical protein